MHIHIFPHTNIRAFPLSHKKSSCEGNGPKKNDGTDLAHPDDATRSGREWRGASPTGTRIPKDFLEEGVSTGSG